MHPNESARNEGEACVEEDDRKNRQGAQAVYVRAVAHPSSRSSFIPGFVAPQGRKKMYQIREERRCIK